MGDMVKFFQDVIVYLAGYLLLHQHPLNCLPGRIGGSIVVHSLFPRLPLVWFPDPLNLMKATSKKSSLSLTSPPVPSVPSDFVYALGIEIDTWMVLRSGGGGGEGEPGLTFLLLKEVAVFSKPKL